MTHKLWSNHKWIGIKLVFWFLVIKASNKKVKTNVGHIFEKLIRYHVWISLDITFYVLHITTMILKMISCPSNLKVLKSHHMIFGIKYRSHKYEIQGRY